MPGRIEDYALIGDTKTAALVCNDGSIDWLCLPRFDSPACFARLLGSEDNGHWRISPAGGIRRIRRSYRASTMVLETTFDTEGGTVRLTDFMVPSSERDEVRLVRMVEGLAGTVPMDFDLVIRFDYGRTVPWVTRREWGMSAISGPNSLEILSPVPLLGRAFRTVSEFAVRDGDRLPFVMSWHRSTSSPPAPLDPFDALNEAVRWWSAWSPGPDIAGRWSEAVVRSLLTLKALTHPETGGSVAAATTSLPERIGGGRNWDYRYCWLRDATYTLYAFYLAGLREELEQWRSWLLRAIAGRPAQLQIMYGLEGERMLPETELPWLCGYENSAPVRIGNAACSQFQLDVPGEILDALHFSRRAGIEDSRDTWEVQRALVDYVDQVWREPDEGLWEIRGPRRHFTHSKVMAWVAFDRAVKAVQRTNADGPAEAWAEARDEIHSDICRRAYDPDLGTFVQSYGTKDLDGSLLMLPLVGFLPAGDPRMTGTVKAIEEGLMSDGFVYRYRADSGIDGLEGAEGSFLVCSFWYVDNLALAGRRKEARIAFERILSVRNDVGLLAEQYDPVSKRQLGNFPQAFSHVGLVNAASNIIPGAPTSLDRADWDLLEANLDLLRGGREIGNEVFPQYTFEDV